VIQVPYIRTRYLVLGTLRYSSRPHTSLACHSFFSLAPGLLPTSARYPLFTCRTFYADATSPAVTFSTSILRQPVPTTDDLRSYLRPLRPCGPTAPTTSGTRCSLLPVGFPTEPYGQVSSSFLLRQSLTPCTIAVYI